MNSSFPNSLYDSISCIIPEHSLQYPQSVILVGQLKAKSIPETLEQEFNMLQGFKNYSSLQERLSFMQGRLLARIAIQKLMSIDFGWIGENSNGLAIWPDEISGSIHHSDDYTCVWVHLNKHYPHQVLNAEIKSLTRYKSETTQYSSIRPNNEESAQKSNLQGEVISSDDYVIHLTELE